MQFDQKLDIFVIFPTLSIVHLVGNNKILHSINITCSWVLYTIIYIGRHIIVKEKQSEIANVKLTSV